MNPVLGVGPTSKAAATLFTLLHLTHAQFLGPDSGNVGEYKHFFYSVQFNWCQALSVLFQLEHGVEPCGQICKGSLQKQDAVF